MEELNPDLEVKDDSDLEVAADKAEAKTEEEAPKAEEPKEEDKRKKKVILYMTFFIFFSFNV